MVKVLRIIVPRTVFYRLPRTPVPTRPCSVLPISGVASVTLHLVALEALATFGEGWLSGGRGHGEGRKRERKREKGRQTVRERGRGEEWRRGGIGESGAVCVWVSVTWGRVGVRARVYTRRASDGFSEVAIAYEVKVRLHDSRAT